MKTIWFASNNENKIKEMRFLFPEIKIKSIKDFSKNIDIPEDQPTFEGNALFKAKYFAKLVKEPVIADDSGICVKKLDNFPGIYSARWAKPETDWEIINQKLLNKMLEKKLLSQKEREAFFVSVTAFVDLEKQIESTFRGEIDGFIVNEPIGENGFAYDRIFQPNGFNLTYAQMSNEQKSQISHRKKSIDLLQEFLKENDYL